MGAGRKACGRTSSGLRAPEAQFLRPFRCFADACMRLPQRRAAGLRAGAVLKEPGAGRRFATVMEACSGAPQALVATMCR